MDIGTRYNYYDILEVPVHCPQHEITTAYERARTTYSGDNAAIYTMFSNDEARDLLQLVEEAYSVLGNKTLRALYDEKIGQKRAHSELSFAALHSESKIQPSESVRKPAPAKMAYKVNEAMEAEIKACKDWTGEMIQKVREYKGYSVEKLSETTKVSSYYIVAVENLDPKNLPAAVYVRGYVSQISKTLGLDEKTVCDSYMKKFKDALEKKS
jgi:curved DNA-binding protein CbpA